MSSTSNRLERNAYRELVLERLRLVPKGHWTLAGGANHRFVVKIESEPRPGLRKSDDDHSVAPAGARRIWWSEPVVCTTGLYPRRLRRSLSMGATKGRKPIANSLSR